MDDCPWPEEITFEDITRLAEMERGLAIRVALFDFLKRVEPGGLPVPVLKTWDWGRCDG